MSHRVRRAVVARRGFTLLARERPGLSASNALLQFFADLVLSSMAGSQFPERSLFWSLLGRIPWFISRHHVVL
jgi:hypothetical protein